MIYNILIQRVHFLAKFVFFACYFLYFNNFIAVYVSLNMVLCHPISINKEAVCKYFLLCGDVRTNKC